MKPFNYRSLLYSALILSVLLGSCAKQIPVPEQAEKIVVVNAFLETGSPIHQVDLTTLDSGQGMIGVSGLEVRISDGEQAILLTESSTKPGNYIGDDSFLIASGKDYHLDFLWQGEAISASTKSTPQLVDLEVSKQFIDTQVENDLLFLEWQGVNEGSVNEYFYLVTVRPLQAPDELESINRSPDVLQGPRAIGVTYNPELTLVDEFFYYYGEHLVEVRAINKTHEAFFRAQMDYSLNAPGNVTGAAGFFVGTSVLSTVIDIR